MGTAARYARWPWTTAIAISVGFFSAPSPASPFLIPGAPSSNALRSNPHACSRTSSSASCSLPGQRLGRHDGPAVASKHRRAKGGATMERPSGQFQRLAKPKYDKSSPNAVLGEVAVPGLEQVCMSAQMQLFPKREAVQLIKDRLQAWCDEENRREQDGVQLHGKTPSEHRTPRTWRAYEFIALPSRNRTLDSEVLGMNVGLAPNDTRLEVVVDFGDKAEAPGLGARMLDMVADLSREPNDVFGYEDDAAAGGERLGPWKKTGNVNSWRKWLHLDSGEPLPESAVTAFRTVQANWADPSKIAAAMNFTVFWSASRLEESVADPATPLRRIEVLHSAEHPHVLKIMETFASSDDMLDHYHRCYTDYLEGVFDFRAAVNPTVQTYTPLLASLRPSLSAGLIGGAMVPLVAIGGSDDGVAPSPDVILEGLKLGLRHVVLEAGSSGINEAVEALVGALAFGVLRRDDLFVTIIVGEDRARLAGGDGLAATVRQTLASGLVDDADGAGGGAGGGDDGGRLLNSVDALVLARGSGKYFDDDAAFLELWDEAREAAVSSPTAALPTSPSTGSTTAGSPLRSVPRLARHVGIGGFGPHVARRLYLLVETEAAQIAKGSGEAEVPGSIPGIVPAMLFGDLRAGDGAATSQTIDFCRDRGVQAFSLRYVGGEGGEEAWKGAAAAAEYDHEDLTGDQVLAKWVMELGSGVVWRPRETGDVARTLTLARYFLPPEWMTEIVDRGGCPPKAWARTLSRLLPPGGTPSEEELEAEADETIAMLMDTDDPQEGDDEGADGPAEDYL